MPVVFPPAANASVYVFAAPVFAAPAWSAADAVQPAVPVVSPPAEPASVLAFAALDAAASAWSAEAAVQSALPVAFPPAEPASAPALAALGAAASDESAAPVFAKPAFAAPGGRFSAASWKDAAALAPAVLPWTVRLSDVLVFQFPHNPGNRYPDPPNGRRFPPSVFL